MKNVLFKLVLISLLITFSCEEDIDTPPTLSIVTPTSTVTLNGLTEVVIDANDDVKVKNVELYFNNILIRTDDSEPYSFLLDLNAYPSGSYALKSIAYDNKNQSTSKEIVVTVNNPVPSVSIVSPENGEKFSGFKEFLIEAIDDDSVAKIELFIDNALVGSDDVSPYIFIIDFTTYNPGIHAVKAIATDRSGATAKHEIIIEVIQIVQLDRPIGLTASKGTYGSKIVVQWSAIPGAETYEIYRKAPSDEDYIHMANTPLNSFTDENVENPLTDYFYKVRVYNSEFAFSAFSDVGFGYSNGQKYQLVRSFGEEGTSSEQFGFVALISIDDSGILYLSDNSNIKKFTSEGEFLGLFKSSGDSQAPLFIGQRVVTSSGYNLIIEENNVLVAKVPTGMNIVGQMGHDGSHIYLAVNYNAAEGYNHHRIYKYDLDGNMLTSFGSKGSQPGQFNEPWGVSFYNDQIIVTSQLGKKAVFFTTDGYFVKEIDFASIANITYGNFVKDGVLYVAAGAFVIKTDFNGTRFEKIGEGILTGATSVVVDNAGNIIVAEPYERKIRVFHE